MWSSSFSLFRWRGGVDSFRCLSIWEHRASPDMKKKKKKKEKTIGIQPEGTRTRGIHSFLNVDSVIKELQPGLITTEEMTTDE